ncbi:hypothetical protein BJ980_000078 [Nocardioides daedukensis]|uniref:DUF3618 domain-containing protein n=1 Tax=Nocardioides daedukensis TaxID=634462 RepID=A0A7Y9S0A9_9ACTN|nr:DUF3618 domain-containing protein [Nocardioides daedukensis]NYG57155.1 hypothetical protein [Nocardioides daedukensis]
MATPEHKLDQAGLQRDIEDTRERLGDTLDQLSDKLNAKKQARAHAKTLALAGSVVVVLTALVVWRRRSR